MNDDVVMTYFRRLWPIAVLASLHGNVRAAEARLDFDGEGDFAIHGQSRELEIVPGVSGYAWRSDGSSAYLSKQVAFDGQRLLAASLWVALESYPSDREGPVDQASPSSFLTQATKGEGFDLWIDTYGRWGATIETSQGEIELRAPERFPLYRWTNIAFAFDPRSGEAMLMLDSLAIATKSVRPGTLWRPAGSELLVARPTNTASVLNFTVNLLNGAFDSILVTQDPERWREALVAQPGALPPVEQSLAVPEGRFAADFLRPRYHAMPPANWTNEPHGLVLVNGRYHLFYQRTPNGPFKTQMVWGHMSSADLVNWTHHRDALRPELQTDTFGFDMKGIWSGDVIVDGNKAYAYYTSVNHGPSEAFNPGISVAVSSDPLLRAWEKRGPIIDTTYVDDFRDPYLWREDGVWHMIIGAALKSGGGLDYYTCTKTGGDTCWAHVRRFSSVPYAQMDVGSTIWEMPVFEDLDGRRLLIVNPIGGKVSKYGDPATRGMYWLGSWRDGLFAPDHARPRRLDLFPGHLSPAVARRPDGTLVGIGIVDERRTPQAQEDARWAHTFSLPREYFLNAAGVLGQRPLSALKGLRKDETSFAVIATGAGFSPVADVGHQYEAAVSFSGSLTGPYGIVLARSPDGSEQTRVLYDPKTRRFILDKSVSSLRGEDEGPLVLHQDYDADVYGEPRDWRIFIDGSVVDVFIGDGAAFSFRTYPKARQATGFGILREDGAQAAGTLWRLDAARFGYDFSPGSAPERAVN